MKRKEISINLLRLHGVTSGSSCPYEKTCTLISVPNPEEEYLGILKNKPTMSASKYDEQIQTKAKLLKENAAISSFNL